MRTSDKISLILIIFGILLFIGAFSFDEYEARARCLSASIGIFFLSTLTKHKQRGDYDKQEE